MKKVLALSLLLIGCGQLPPYEQKVAEVCGRLEGCFDRFVQEGCNWSLTEFYILPESCLDEANETESCDQLGDENNALSMCWPPCEVDSQQCDGDTIRVCKNGQYFHAQCSGVCQMLTGSEYSGVCGRVSPDGEIVLDDDVCWCG